ncbi:DNA-processing protein DprA [Pontiella agarivorans]|uniref:DNA-processing protein DprA n=1 Tax=Pontiella agarivorans TaxID=3038953 RepID=A0ABU5MXW8_9BACT|nr:DNA-processing protein DprA [Pontiella agarivorans]MDZ8119052.1 DNA-processing protein DprA [Pontiella agarivorans]
MQERLAYITLNMIEGLGPVSVRRLIDCLGSPRAILEADREELMKARGVGEKLALKIITQRDSIDAEAEIDRAAALGAQIITPMDKGYPEALKAIHDPPLALYMKGDLVPEDGKALAIVGSRSTSQYGLKAADRFAFQLGQTGFTVVSGLARGTDTAAHRGALKSSGRTVAVLGGAIDRLYPPENAELAEQIAKQGAVISEYPLGRQADRMTFPYRNRIISGLSMGVLLIESDVKGGSMHTADAATEQGRTVFALPGRIDTPGAKGPHLLIKNGAKLVQSLDDILEEYELLLPAEELEMPASATAARPDVPLTEQESKVVEALWQEPLDVDALARRIGMASHELSGLLLGLEMKRVIKTLPGKVVELSDDLRTGFR